jgi:hypothetical protein
MWGDILSTNSSEIEQALGALAREIDVVRSGLRADPPNVEPALTLLARARTLRRR